MADIQKVFKQYTAPEISRRHSPSVDYYHEQGLAVAGPFFKAGGRNICLSQMPEYEGKRHRSPWHRFILMIQGRMECQIGKDCFIAEPGDLICTPAGIETLRRSLEPIEWIYLDIDDTPLWTPLKKAGPTVRKYESAGLMYILVKEIVEALRSQDLYSISCAHDNSETLARLLQREIRQYSKEWKPKRTDSMIDLVERIRKNPEYQWTRPALAKAVGTSERNLTIIFNQVFGTSPGKMIIRIRMEHAMMLLKDSTDSIEEIAKAVGYENIVSFSRAFKKHMDMTPGVYREKVNE